LAPQIRAEFPDDPSWAAIEESVFHMAKVIHETIEERLSENLTVEHLGFEVYEEALGVALHWIDRWMLHNIGPSDRELLIGWLQPRVAAFYLDDLNSRSTRTADSVREAEEFVARMHGGFMTLLLMGEAEYAECESVGINNERDKTGTVVGVFATMCAAVMIETDSLKPKVFSDGSGPPLDPIFGLMFQGVSELAIVMGIGESKIIDQLENRYGEPSGPPKTSNRNVNSVVDPTPRGVDPKIVIGLDIPWDRIKGMMLRARSFDKTSRSIGARSSGNAMVEILGGASQQEAQILLAVLPIDHSDDFKVINWIFNESDLSDQEEVIVSYQPARLFGGGKPKFTVMVFPAGSLEQMNSAPSSGAMPSPIWSRDPGGNFTPPNSIHGGGPAARGKIGPTDTF